MLEVGVCKAYAAMDRLPRLIGLRDKPHIIASFPMIGGVHDQNLVGVDCPVGERIMFFVVPVALPCSMAKDFVLVFW